ncbi:hypothetical protein DPMN_133916 [Dreissena polymorpha]|uniref:Uncharacterized protein n=1 Tax=Dreissena polymorpha TaxID=45954 RepID=A0A9D4JA80_DREPO|nr:hypothetical protein DPMN_133916 [Dreissena polymorpha]
MRSIDALPTKVLNSFINDNISFLSKVIENAALFRLNIHINENSLLPKNLSAYRQVHSCESALLRLANDRREGKEEQEAKDHIANKRFKPTSFSVERSAIHEFERCALVFNNWMNENKLKMNASKTEFIMFGIQIRVAGDK